MILYNFIANFGSEEASRLHFKKEQYSMEFNVNVALKNIFGFKVDGVMNVKDVE
jgi:hypothetical protein